MLPAGWRSPLLALRADARLPSAASRSSVGRSSWPGGAHRARRGGLDEHGAFPTASEVEDWPAGAALMSSPLMRSAGGADD